MVGFGNFKTKEKLRPARVFTFFIEFDCTRHLKFYMLNCKQCVIRIFERKERLLILKTWVYGMYKEVIQP